MKLNPAIERILEHKRAEVASLKNIVPAGALLESAAKNGARRSLRAAMLGKTDTPKVIAEIKRSSPSRCFRPVGFDPVQIARGYQSAGAAAISVLTDARFFNGNQVYVPLVREAVGLPVLRKDFIVDVWQVAESAALGADAVLVMAVNFPDTAAMAQVYEEVIRLGMEPLVEIHSEKDWELAKPLNPQIVGINNRDFLSPDLKVDLKISRELAPKIPDGTAVISESGISGYREMEELIKVGVDGFLIGSSLMQDENPGQALSRLLTPA